MRSEGELRNKIRQAQFRHLKRLLRKRFPSDGDWDREEVQRIKAEFKEFMATAAIHEIAKDFPDVAALLWVLDSERETENILIPDASLVGSLGGVFLWADTQEEASKARTILDTLATDTPTTLAPRKKGWFSGWFS